MSKTKDRILQQARQLYNERGVDQVTARHLAEVLGMSDGNLRYHFRDREALISALYDQLVAELNEGYGLLQTQSVDLHLLYALTEFTYQKLYDFRFLMLDFAGIMRQHPHLKAHFQLLMMQRKQMFEHLLAQLIEEEWLTPPFFPHQYEYFRQQFQILGDFWLSSAEILYQGPAEERLPHYVRLAFSSLGPYLTEKGKGAFREVIAEWPPFASD
jgi:AcrR family transcriptional regulator